MLTKILAKDFKGLSFTQELSQYNLFLGGNGVGKSARSQALTLAIMGYLPSDGKKKPGDIFQIHSHNGTPFSVGFETNLDGVKQVFSRTFRNGDGVSQDVACNKEKLKQTQVEKILFQLGDPRIFDLKEFIELSEQKKIDLIFSLFPPEKDLGNLEEELEAIAEKEKPASQEIKALELTISNLTKARSEISIPAGTLAEVRKEISDKETTLADAMGALKEIEIKEREEKAKADAEAKAKIEAERTQAKAEADAKKREEDIKKQAEKEKETAIKAAKEKGREEGKAEAKIEAQAGKEDSTLTLKPVTVHEDLLLWSSENVLNDITKIRETMERAKCGACSALIVVKTILAKYRSRKEAA